MPRRLKSPLVLAIDIGSTSIRARLYDAAAWQVGGAGATVAHAVPFTPDGGSEDDPAKLCADVETVIDRVMAHPAAGAAEIGGVGLSTYVGNMLGIDRAGAAVTPLYSYADSRSAQDVEQLRPRLGTPDHYTRTGAPLHTAYQAPRIAWLKRTRPDSFDDAYLWTDLGAYLYGRWFGTVDIPSSYSVASWSGMLDRFRLTWDVPTLEAVGVDPDRLPKLADYTTAMRGLARPYAKRWPRLAQVPLFLAVADGAAANIGVGCVGADSCALTAGTTGAMRAVVPGTPDIAPNGLWAYRLDADYSVVGGAVTDAGSLFQWLMTNLRLPRSRALEEALAASPAAAHGVSVMPFLRGERSPGWATDATAAFLGVRATTTGVDLVRASLEAVAYRFVLIWRLLRQVAPAREIVVGGRAARSSPAWMQIMADALQMPLVGSVEQGTTTRGIAVMALKALGVIERYDSLPVPRLERYLPNADNGAAHHSALAAHEALYDILVAPTNSRM
ncbi:MAG: gluconokinase [Chloroflexi bacterium]|nr:gluconokinase [Chloroflexota bacterium]